MPAMTSALDLPTLNAGTGVGDLARAAIDLLSREENILRRVIARYVRDPHVVDDLFQEVSLKVLRRIESVRDPATLRGWLYQLARNACLDWLRHQERQRASADSAIGERTAVGDLGRSPLDQVLSAERVDAVRRALDQLPASQREAINLRVEEGLDHEAIAARLGISRQAVEVRLCRGRSALKEKLDAILGGDL